MKAKIVNQVAEQVPVKKSSRLSSFIKEITYNKAFYLMMLPGLLFVLIMYYFPMFGSIIAFKSYNPTKGIWKSEWVGLKNFEFFFVSESAWRVTFNTIFYNTIFIVVGLGFAVLLAILLNEMIGKYSKNIYKSVAFLPYLLSWVVAQYILFAFLSVDKGLINTILKSFGMEGIMWYTEPWYWRVILPMAYIWKTAGYFTVIFLAGITGISHDYYEAADMDGATRWQKMRYITLPLIMPVVITMFLLQAGKIFYGGLGDWNMFYTLPMNSGILYSSTDVIDTFVYRALRQMNDFGMSAAAGLYQSVVGLILVTVSNLVVKKYDPDSALF